MSANHEIRERVSVDLAISGSWMLFNALIMAGYTLVAPAGGLAPLTATTALAFAMMIAFAASGVEIFRRRHFLIAIVPPAAMAVADLASGELAGQLSLAISGVVIFGLVATDVAFRRSRFT